MKQYGNFIDIVKFMGMTVFSMSFAGIAIPVCNEMKYPQNYEKGISVGEFFNRTMILLNLKICTKYCAC